MPPVDTPPWTAPGGAGTGSAGAAAALRNFAAALDACHELAGPGALVSSAVGWAVASAGRLPEGAPVPGGFDALAVTGPGAPSPDRARELFADGLLRLHRELLRGLLDAVVVRLNDRTSEGATLLNRQLVRSAVADVALTLTEAADLLAIPDRTAARRHRIHRGLVDAGRVAIKLYGASGFVADGPGRLLYLAELLGNTYLLPDRRERDEDGNE
ncbi:hypothetical protein ABT263_26715 [Kitasatospora sp. NPDC001603]|uniref:hypothetical protein n=1 Tax=Kitasatospora sp. NPDC001603 TaxID=3154388 RepID=UPI0033224082